MEDIIFDQKRLLESTCDDRELAIQVVAEFVLDIPKQLASLASALAGSDAPTAERVAHSIKGAAATVGGERLRELAAACEALGHEGRLPELAAQTDSLRREFDALLAALRDNGYVAT